MSATDAIRAELTGSDRCTCADITAQGNAPTILLCRELLAQGFDPDTTLSVFRNGTLALRVKSIAKAAALEIASDGIGFRPARAPDTASPMRQKEFDVSGTGSTATATSEAVT